jgi:carboxymethylenebutenolidase
MTTPLIAFAVLFLLTVPANAQEWARAALDASPRHHEWVDVPVDMPGDMPVDMPGDGRTVHALVAFPERKGAAPAVIVIHENRGLTDWVGRLADQLAAEGYVAIAPDLLSGFDAAHRTTADFADSDAAREAIYDLDADRITADLLAVRKYVAALPAANGTTAVMGFCWGGGQAFRFATDAPGLAAALVFYGTPPGPGADLKAISAQVHGFYGAKDWRINATIPETRSRMERAGRDYDPVVYEGAGHAFMRVGDDPDGSREAKAAQKKAWGRVKTILAGLK